MRLVRTGIACLMLGLGACGGEGGNTEDEALLPGVEVGKGDTATPIRLRRLASTRSGLAGPTGLAFNPRVPGELWIVNHDDDSAVIIQNAIKGPRKALYRKDGYAIHFMAWPTSIAFGDDWTTFGVPGTFATCGESRNDYGMQAPPNDFMGPVLWSSDLRIFARMNPYGLGSHLDMLHETPNCMGIAHQARNVYWAIGGLTPAVYQYDFMQDHHIGQDDHSDGLVRRFAEGEVSTVAGVPSGLVYRDADKMLYIADTGNGRIAKLDTTSGTVKGTLGAPEPLVAAYDMGGAKLADVVPASSGLLKAPSGLALYKDQLYVSDNTTSEVSIFDLQGNRVKYYQTNLPTGSLGGLTVGSDGLVYVVDLLGSQLLRLEP